MRAVFLSYRREDSEGQAGRLFENLVAEFGEAAVFMDVAGIQPGRDFRRAIDEQVASCGVLLAVIGRDWCDAKDESGRRRLEDPADFVRLETAAALKRDIPVIPVLVRGARMPKAEQLPSELRDLAYRNAVELSHARWDSDVEVLVRALRTYIEREAGPLGKTGVTFPLERPSPDVPRKSAERSDGHASTGPRLSRAPLLAFIGVVIGVAVALLGYTQLRHQTDTPSTATAERPNSGGAGLTASQTNPAASTPGGGDAGRAPGRPRMTVNTCGSVGDATTGLEWFIGPDEDTTFSRASAWVTRLSACGGGWRMPSIEELETLYDPSSTAGLGHIEKGRRFPAHLPPEFSRIGGGSWVWSGEAVNSTEARSFNFNQGIAVTYARDTSRFSTRAFAVRRRPSTS